MAEVQILLAGSQVLVDRRGWWLLVRIYFHFIIRNAALLVLNLASILPPTLLVRPRIVVLGTGPVRSDPLVRTRTPSIPEHLQRRHGRRRQIPRRLQGIWRRYIRLVERALDQLHDGVVSLLVFVDPVAPRGAGADGVLSLLEAVAEGPAVLLLLGHHAPDQLLQLHVQPWVLELCARHVQVVRVRLDGAVDEGAVADLPVVGLGDQGHDELLTEGGAKARSSAACIGRLR